MRLLLLPLLFVAFPSLAESPGPSAAVFDLVASEGTTEGTARLITENVAAEIRRAGTFTRVISSSEIEGIIGVEKQKQVLACDAQSCLAELAGALGADYLVMGNIGKLGNSWLLNLKLIQSRTTIVVSASRRMQGSTAEALLDAVNPAVDEMLINAKLMRADVKPAPEPAPAALVPAAQSSQATASESGSSKGSGLPKIALGSVGIAVGAVGLVVSLGVVAAAVLTVVVPYFIVHVPTTGLPPEARRIVFPAAAGALTLAAVLTGIVGLALVVAGGAGVAGGVIN